MRQIETSQSPEPSAMTEPYKVAVLIGSLRKNSYSGQLARALIDLAPKSLAFTIVEIGDLPLYNQDIEAEAPAPYHRFRTEMRSAAAVLFVTPEYNRSIPGGLKNAIDVGSRPYGQSVFNGKAAAVISQSPGAIGGFGANHVLRQSLVFLNMPVMQQPEAYIGHSAELFDETGAVKTEATHHFLKSIIDAFAAWVALFDKA
jgi:chromate reductase